MPSGRSKYRPYNLKLSICLRQIGEAEWRSKAQAQHRPKRTRLLQAQSHTIQNQDSKQSALKAPIGPHASPKTELANQLSTISCPGNSLWQLRNPMRRIMNTQKGSLYSMILHLRSSIRVLQMPMGRHLWESTFRLQQATCDKLWHSEPNMLVLKIKWLTSMKHRASGKKMNS